ncbi:elongation factor P 5-aminopentanone reductase [Virgibacillus sp. SK37]|uniref:elongation factor P 5-aminopentanone reductase n=1 Tax=Virgibacillus sp. SK37 TaxID=403957 RepID=UPI0004D1DFB4|nr:SDR family oxidoreductase [Virgibacillus sp. SK37]AIF43697.1 3-ketoacyl-ACP reductase [Virgibacillus sp. SK37]
MGNNVLIIGASGDIGIAISKRLAQDGYKLILHYNKNKEALGHYIKDLSSEAILQLIQADLTSSIELKRFLQQLVFPVDHIVFASGKTSFGVFQHATEALMDEMLALHVKSPWVITKELLPDMIRRKTGNIIFITSIWAEQGASNEVLYSSVKGSQNSFVRALAKEVAPSGISVNAISPGYIDTKMNGHFLEDEKKVITEDIPMNRAGHPDEVAHVVSFLMDSRSSYIQGEVINITGGW